MAEHDKERISGETVEEIEGRKYTDTLIQLAAIRRERHGINNEPIIEGEIKPPLPIVDPLVTTDNNSATDNIAGVISFDDDKSSRAGLRLHTTKQQKREERRKAA